MTHVHGTDDHTGLPRRGWRVDTSLYVDADLGDLERGVAVREAIGHPERTVMFVRVKRVAYADAPEVLHVTPGADWPAGKDLLIVTAQLAPPP